MRLGYNTSGFASHALADALKVLSEIGYESVGITIDHHALNPFSAGHTTEVGECAALLEDLGLEPVVETGARFLLDPRRKHRPTLLERDVAARATRIDFLERSVDVASVLGSEVVSLWSGRADDGDREDAAVLDARLADGLRGLCARAETSGVKIGFEPEPGMHVETVEHFERVSRLVDHPAFCLTLDVGHAHLLDPGGAAATIRRAADRIVNVHLEGMRRPVHEHLPPWEGDLDVAGAWTALEEVGYGGPVTLELSRHSHDAVEIAKRAFAFFQTPS